MPPGPAPTTRARACAGGGELRATHDTQRRRLSARATSTRRAPASSSRAVQRPRASHSGSLGAQPLEISVAYPIEYEDARRRDGHDDAAPKKNRHLGLAGTLVGLARDLAWFHRVRVKTQRAAARERDGLAFRSPRFAGRCGAFAHAPAPRRRRSLRWRRVVDRVWRAAVGARDSRRSNRCRRWRSARASAAARRPTRRAASSPASGGRAVPDTVPRPSRCKMIHDQLLPQGPHAATEGFFHAIQMIHAEHGAPGFCSACCPRSRKAPRRMRSASRFLAPPVRALQRDETRWTRRCRRRRLCSLVESGCRLRRRDAAHRRREGKHDGPRGRPRSHRPQAARERCRRGRDRSALSRLTPRVAASSSRWACSSRFRAGARA